MPRAACSVDSSTPVAFSELYSEDGTFQINDGAVSRGREEIAEAAEDVMTSFPDMTVRMTDLRLIDDHVEFHWNWAGTHTGPGGTGNSVDLNGFGRWTLDEAGLILESRGRLDADEYQRQLTVD